MLAYGQAEQNVMNKNVVQKEKRLDAITQAEVYKKEAKDAARQALFAAGEQAAALGADVYNDWRAERNATGPSAPVLQGGGKIKKTPGQFSHQNNPIDIVRKGKKIGEMTGGEYVLNPSQAAKIQSLAGAQKKEALARYVNGLFKQFNNK
jgi:hypothetical protein